MLVAREPGPLQFLPHPLHGFLVIEQRKHLQQPRLIQRSQRLLVRNLQQQVEVVVHEGNRKSFLEAGRSGEAVHFLVELAPSPEASEPLSRRPGTGRSGAHPIRRTGDPAEGGKRDIILPQLGGPPNSTGSPRYRGRRLRIRASRTAAARAATSRNRVRTE